MGPCPEYNVAFPIRALILRMEAPLLEFLSKPSSDTESRNGMQYTFSPQDEIGSILYRELLEHCHGAIGLLGTHDWLGQALKTFLFPGQQYPAVQRCFLL